MSHEGFATSAFTMSSLPSTVDGCREHRKCREGDAPSKTSGFEGSLFACPFFLSSVPTPHTLMPMGCPFVEMPCSGVVH